MTRVLVTGANGFVGRAVVAQATAAGHEVVPVVRRIGRADAEAGDARRIAVGDLTADTAWGPVLTGVDAVVHLAARVHVMRREREADAWAAFRTVNVEATESLACQAAAAGVRRLVYVSSIKVNGERTQGRPFGPEDDPAPVDAYGRSKLAAEIALRRVAADSGLELVIVRPPMVAGPGVGGNLRRLLDALARGWPLPLAAVRNRRSLVSRANLAALLVAATTRPQAAGQTLLAADEPALSTPALLHGLAAGLGRPARLFVLPTGVLRALGRWTGAGAAADRLLGSLEVDGMRARRILAVAPVETLAECLRQTGLHYAQRRGT